MTDQTRPGVDGVRLIARDGPALNAFYQGLFGDRAGAWFDVVHAPSAEPAAAGDAGLFHTAVLLPHRAALSAFARRLAETGVALDGASDHGVSEALYLSDPEGNGIEVYADRARADWPRDAAGDIELVTRRLDLRALAAASEDPWSGAPEGSTIGHVHLKVGDARRAERFLTETLGLETMARRDAAVFMGWDGYHHHIAGNHWRSAGASPRPRGRSAGLEAVRVRAPITAPAELVDPWGTVIAATPIAAA